MVFEQLKAKSIYIQWNQLLRCFLTQDPTQMKLVAIFIGDDPFQCPAFRMEIAPPKPIDGLPGFCSKLLCFLLLAPFSVRQRLAVHALNPLCIGFCCRPVLSVGP